MKILINALSARLGGGQTYLTNLLARIPAELDIELFLISPESLVIPDNIKSFTKLPVSQSLINSLWKRSLWEKYVLPSLIKKHDINVLFCPGGSLNTSNIGKCKTVVTFQNMLPFDMRQVKKYGVGFSGIRNRILKFRLLKSMQRADLVIFISQYAREYINSIANKKIKRSVCIYHGVDPVFRKKMNVPMEIPSWLPDDGYLLYVSPLDVYKAQLEVIEAYAALKKNGGQYPKLILVGTHLNTKYSQEVKTLIKNLKLEKYVICKGHISYSDLPSIYQSATVNIFASQTENCPFILLEALSAGRPLVVSSCQPMPEIAGNAVLYFDPTKPSELTSLLKQLLDNPSQMKDLAELSLQKSFEYDWAKSSKETWKAIASIV